MYQCPCCGGDGKETCNNPDHGFIVNMPGEIGRLGCPGCGHSPNHKVKSGGPCITCGGAGVIVLEEFDKFCEETGFDDEPIEVPPPPTTPSVDEGGER